MTERTKRLSRRNFLLAVGAGGAATAAAIVAKNTGSSPSADKNKRASRGYHATEHVNNYYRTTKV
jgi:shikimate 5-dehydrogenase